MGLGHAEICEQLRDELRAHRAAAVSVNRELARRDAVAFAGLFDPFSASLAARRATLRLFGTHDVPRAHRKPRGPRAARAAHAPALCRARTTRHRARPAVVVGHHQAQGRDDLGVLPPVRDRRVQPVRRRLDGRAEGERRTRERYRRPGANGDGLDAARRHGRASGERAECSPYVGVGVVGAIPMRPPRPRDTRRHLVGSSPDDAARLRCAEPRARRRVCSPQRAPQSRVCRLASARRPTRARGTFRPRHGACFWPPRCARFYFSSS